VVHGPSEVSFSGHTKSIVTKADGFDYVFEDAPKFDLSVTNGLSVGITISNGYIDADKDNDTSNNTEFEAGENNTPPSPPTAVIHTATPVFTVTPASSDPPVESLSLFVVEYKIADSTMTVTISPKTE
jgi:hypothetical protein